MSSGNGFEEDTIQELREINRLVYLRPSNGALIDKRTMKNYNFGSPNYSMGANAQAIVNSGGDFIWGPTSYLKVTITAEGGATFGNGNLLNIFRNSVLTHRSGEILEHIHDSNVLGRILSKYMVSKDDQIKIDSMLGVPVDAAAKTYTRCVPLWMLFGIFGNQSEYIPGGFLAGAKIELQLETNKVASASDKNYSDIKLELVLDSAQVYDSVQKQLLEEQASVAGSGLQYTYSTYFNSFQDFPTSSVSYDIQQSASITEMVAATVRVAATVDTDNADSFTFLGNLVTNYQYRLGSEYFPQQAVNATVAGQTVEPYYHALTAFNSSPHQYEGYSSSGGGSNVEVADYYDKHGVYAQTLEKSASGLMLSGQPTNNSRLLNLSMTKTSVTHRINVMLKYIRVANIMGDSLVVDR